MAILFPHLDGLRAEAIRAAGPTVLGEAQELGAESGVRSESHGDPMPSRLLLLIEGATAISAVEGNPEAGRAARVWAESLLD